MEKKETEGETRVGKGGERKEREVKRGEERRNRSEEPFG